MPSHATAQHNSEIRRRQRAGEDITAADHSSRHAIPPIDNPASPAEFPRTAEEYAPQANRFAPRTDEQRAAYEQESQARHGAMVEGDEVEPADRFAPGASVDADVAAEANAAQPAEEEEEVDVPPGGDEEEEIADGEA